VSDDGRILIRRWIIFWIFTPLLLTILYLLVVSILGALFGSDYKGIFASTAFAIGLAATLLPAIAVHLTVCASIFGLVQILIGMKPDRTLVLAIVVGFILSDLSTVKGASRKSDSSVVLVGWTY
jgi:hypothetical protein